MQSPEYRIVSICPGGLSAQLRGHLNAPLKDAPPLLTKDLIAITLTEIFSATRLSFAGICLGWAKSSLSPEHLPQWLNLLSTLTCEGFNEPITLELFAQEVEGGMVALGGFYPLMELDAAVLVQEYPQFSMLKNQQKRDELFNWAYREILCGALQSDPSGAICAILAEDGNLAELKIREVAALLQNGAAPSSFK